MINFNANKSAGKVTLPKQITPMANGKAMPKEHLAYLNAAEAHMLKMLTDGKANKTKFGPQSFVDPSGAYGGDMSGTQTAKNWNGSGSQPNSYSGYSGGYGNYGSYGAATGGGIGSSSNSGNSYSSIGKGRSDSSSSSDSASSRSSNGSNFSYSGSSSGRSGSSSSGSGPSSYTDRSNNSAMNGGFGALAFGNSTTSSNAIAKALAAGLSGGVFTPSMNKIGGGWAVGPGVVSGSKAITDRYPTMNPAYQTVDNVPQIPLGVVGNSQKDQSRMLFGNTVNNYQAYQQPPGAGNTAVAQNYNTSMQGGLGQMAYGQSQMPANDLAMMVADGRAYGNDGTQVADAGYPAGYTPNGPETPPNGLDANPAADQPPSLYSANDPTNGQDASYPRHYGPMSPKNVVGRTFWGAVNSAVNTPATPGALLASAQGGGNDYMNFPYSDFGLGRGNVLNDPNNGSKADTSGTSTNTTTPPTAKVPWYYPKYSQAYWWNGLPSGLLGGYIG